MFLTHYGLREQPFGVTPDPRYLYQSRTHREAMASLFYGIESVRGFLALVAEPGMGKTTLLFQLLEKLGKTARTAFLFQTQCDSRELLAHLLADLGLDIRDRDPVRMHEDFKAQLLKEARSGRRFIVVIDEAHNLEDSVLETVRLLSDFENPRTKLLQIILAGHPQLGNKLATPGLLQLRQRISILCRLAPLNPQEIKEYINHRLRVAGYTRGPLFTSAALALIGRYSGGVPRNINNFCFNALSLGFALGKTQIDTEIVNEVAADLGIVQTSSEQDYRGEASGSSMWTSIGTKQLELEPAASTKIAESVFSSQEAELPNDVEAFSERPDQQAAEAAFRDFEVFVPSAATAAAAAGAQSEPSMTMATEKFVATAQIPDSSSKPAYTSVLDSPGFPKPASLFPETPRAFAKPLPEFSELQQNSAERKRGPVVLNPKLNVVQTFVRERWGTLLAAGFVLVALLTLPAWGGKALSLINGPVTATVDSVITEPIQPNAAALAKSTEDKQPEAAEAERKPGVKSSATSVAKKAQPSRAAGTQSTQLPVAVSSVTNAGSADGPHGTILYPPRTSVSQGVSANSPTATNVSQNATVPEPPALVSALVNQPRNANEIARLGLPNVSPPPTPERTVPAPARLRVSQGVIQGNLIKMVPPIYPPFAKSANISGAVVVDAVISKTGEVIPKNVVCGNTFLSKSAMDAVKNWRYRPYYLNGEPTEVDTQIKVIFSISGQDSGRKSSQKETSGCS